MFSAYDKFLGVLSLTITIVGTIGNFFGIILCLRGSLRKTPTYVFIAFMLFCDTISLYFSNLSTFTVAFYVKVFSGLSLATCKLSAFCVYFSLQASVLLLVSI